MDAQWAMISKWTCYTKQTQGLCLHITEMWMIMTSETPVDIPSYTWLFRG